VQSSTLLAEARETKDLDQAVGSKTATPTETLSGLVERVTYHNAENGFCVLRVKARGQRDLVAVVGHAATINAGEFISATGLWTTTASTACSWAVRLNRTAYCHKEFSFSRSKICGAADTIRHEP